MAVPQRSWATGKECVFCGRVPVVQCRVVNARWDAAYPDHMQLQRDVEYDSAGGQRSRVSDSGVYLAAGFDSTVRGVCARCRDGWIDELDEQAAPHLKPLFDGLPHHITHEASDVVARWVEMTAVLVEQDQRPHTRPTISPEQGEALRTGGHPDCFAEFDFPLNSGDVLDARSTGMRMGTTGGQATPAGFGDTSWGVVSIMFGRLHMVCLHAATPMMMGFLDHSHVFELLGTQNQIRTRRGEPWPQSRPQLTQAEATGMHDEILHRTHNGLQAFNPPPTAEVEEAHTEELIGTMTLRPGLPPGRVPTRQFSGRG